MTSPASTRHSLCLLAALLVCSAAAEETGTADHVIHIQVHGGMSRYHTLDPKLLAGEETEDFPLPLDDFFQTYQVSDWMPNLSKLHDDCLILRSVESGRTHINETSLYFRRTGYIPRKTVDYPEIGAWCAASVPDGTFFRLNSTREEGASFFTAKGIAPIAISSVDAAMQLASRDTNQEARSKLLSAIRTVGTSSQGTNEIIGNAFSRKQTERAFLAAKANAAYAHTYGESEFGKACNLARYLVEHGKATYVEVNFPGWDPKPEDDFSELWKAKVSELDTALSTLIIDLKKQKMLDRTLVVLSSDYGRYPFFRNGIPAPDSGRSVALLCGGGVIGRRAIGETDRTGKQTLKGHITAKQFNSLIARALRIDPFQNAFTPNGRPVTIGNSREPSIQGIFRKKK